MENRTGLIVLAAGASSRLGKPKQGLIFKNESLLQHVVNAGINANLSPLIVVEGANREATEAAIRTTDVHTVYNEAWSEGMASSIRTGVDALLGLAPDISAVIIAVCDQPFVSGDLFSEMKNTLKANGRGIVACAYADTLGTPVLFSGKYFNELLGLQGDAGAKSLLMKFREDLATVSFPAGNIDIDSADDYKNLVKDNNKAGT